MAAREPDRIRITEPGGAKVIILRPIVAGDTLRGRSEVGDYPIAIPLGKVLRLETRRSNVVTSDVVIVGMGLGLAGIVVACVASNC